jgi:LPS sulfotransferase NodH
VGAPGASSKPEGGVASAEVRFLIVGARRSGSNLLCSLLDSHPEVLCHHELFNPSGVFCALSLRDADFDPGTIAERDANPAAFLERVFSDPRGHRCVGFKMTHGQAESVLAAVLRDADVRKIVLERRNRVKTYLSEQVAERLDQWEVYDESELATERPLLRVDAAALREHAARNRAFYRRVEEVLRDTGQAHLRVCYEDLWDVETQGAILRFLGVTETGTALVSPSVKQNPRDARRIVANFDELAESLRGDPLRDELLDAGC